ncbi:MAG: PASTA domain-containing protein [Gemmatimonadetes bacterium]|nr:PASTA domain-containing protein [Gemmatimonadota bacterium]
MRKVMLTAATAAASLVLFLLLLDNAVMPYVVKVERVSVPDVDDQPSNEAALRLQREGLRMAVRDSVFSETIPRGHVVEQSPDPGELIKKGRRVFVDLSRGPRLHEVPNVTGGSIREARLQIAGNQLRLGDWVYVSSVEIPRGVVVRQEPAAGTSLPRGGRVSLEISSGSPSALRQVPDLTGLSIAAARDTLRKYEMSMGEIVERPGRAPRAGIVLGQRPEAGKRVGRNTSVELIVSARTTGGSQ